MFNIRYLHSMDNSVIVISQLLMCNNYFMAHKKTNIISLSNETLLSKFHCVYPSKCYEDFFIRVEDSQIHYFSFP